MSNNATAAVIRTLNDELRTTFTGGKVMMTSGVAAMPIVTRAALMQAVRLFDAFDKDNDPHGEHDFGSVEVDGEKFFFKIDYYDSAMEAGSEHPEDPTQTVRVITIMYANEY